MIENHAAKYSDEITLGVGLHYGYGEAQRLYVKRSYILVKLVHRGNKMKNIKIKYLLYLIFLHGACIFLTVSKFLFPKWKEWLINTRFLVSPVSVYIIMIIVIFPLFSVIPYYFKYDFPNASIRKKWIFAAILIGNTLLILVYTSVISKIMS